MKRKPNWDIEIGASNTVRKTATSRRGILRVLKAAQGRVSVVELRYGQEIYFGTVDTVRDAIMSDMLYGLE